jgi:hypothetical protein
MPGAICALVMMNLYKRGEAYKVVYMTILEEKRRSACFNGYGGIKDDGQTGAIQGDKIG